LTGAPPYIFHPELFILLGGGQSLRSGNAVTILIEGIREANEQNLGFTNKRTSHKAKTRKRDGNSSSEDESSDDEPQMASTIE
jgi:hypothetical protein